MDSTIFIPGEKIDLHVPQNDDFDKWASWFNNPKITKYLPQGLYPNTTEMQKEFYDNTVKSGRFLAMIKNKQGHLLGVVSLSNIDYRKQSCQTATVCPEIDREAPLAALEAKALVTEHAFEAFGVIRIFADQPNVENPNANWYKRLEIIGYKAEGMIRNGFKKGLLVGDSISLSVTQKDYLSLKERRGNSLWPGEKKAMKMIKEMNSFKPSTNRVHESIAVIHSEQDEALSRLEDKLDEPND